MLVSLSVRHQNEMLIIRILFARNFENCVRIGRCVLPPFDEMKFILKI